MARTRVTVLTVSHDTMALTALLLWSLRRVLDVPAHVSLDVLVVDNGSTDGSRELLSGLAAAGACRLLTNDRNIGHGPALNQGLASLRTGGAPPQWAWILDSDCVIARPDALAGALRAAEASGRGDTSVCVGEPQWDRWHGMERFELYSLLVDPTAIAGVHFAADGDPAFPVLEHLRQLGAPTAPFAFAAGAFVVHRGRGTLAAVVANEERDNPLYEWAVDHNLAHFGGVAGAAERYASLESRFRAEVPELDAEPLASVLTRRSDR